MRTAPLLPRRTACGPPSWASHLPRPCRPRPPNPVSPPQVARSGGRPARAAPRPAPVWGRVRTANGTPSRGVRVPRRVAGGCDDRLRRRVRVSDVGGRGARSSVDASATSGAPPMTPESEAVAVVLARGGGGGAAALTPSSSSGSLHRGRGARRHAHAARGGHHPRHCGRREPRHPDLPGVRRSTRDGPVRRGGDSTESACCSTTPRCSTRRKSSRPPALVGTVDRFSSWDLSLVGGFGGALWQRALGVAGLRTLGRAERAGARRSARGWRGVGGRGAAVRPAGERAGERQYSTWRPSTGVNGAPRRFARRTTVTAPAGAWLRLPATAEVKLYTLDNAHGGSAWGSTTRSFSGTYAAEVGRPVHRGVVWRDCSAVWRGGERRAGTLTGRGLRRCSAALASETARAFARCGGGGWRGSRNAVARSGPGHVGEPTELVAALGRDRAPTARRCRRGRCAGDAPGAFGEAEAGARAAAARAGVRTTLHAEPSATGRPAAERGVAITPRVRSPAVGRLPPSADASYDA
jgi:hypothetical protein